MAIALSVPASVMAEPVRVGVVVLTKQKSNSSVGDNVRASIVTAVEKMTTATIQLREQAARSIGGTPEAALTRCKTNLGCIARIGRRLRIDDLLFARIILGTSGESVFVIQALLIDVQNKKVLHKSIIQFDKIGDDLDRRLESEALLWFPDALRQQPNPSSEVPAQESANGEEPTSAPTADAHPASVPVVIAPRRIRPAAPVVSGGRAIVLTTRAAPRLSGLGIAGIVVGGVGLCALGVGTYYGFEFTHLSGAVKYGPGGTSQLKSISIEKTANTDSLIANVTLIAGGATLAVGLGILLFDVLRDHKLPPASALLASPGGLSAFTF